MHADRPRPVRIGLSGWNYAHWRDGVFYPPQLPQLSPKFRRDHERLAAALARLLRDLRHCFEFERAERLRGWSRTHEVFAYFNNDWEGCAPRNAAYLKRLLGSQT